MNLPSRLVLVEWEDARIVEGGPWVENKERPYTPHLVLQAGFLTLDTPEGIHIVSAWHPEITSPPDQIPRAMIRRIMDLGPVQARKRKT